ncbi:MAG: EAL domain-containing protein [Betaproteobacteria bacterium]
MGSTVTAAATGWCRYLACMLAAAQIACGALQPNGAVPSIPRTLVSKSKCLMPVGVTKNRKTRKSTLQPHECQPATRQSVGGHRSCAIPPAAGSAAEGVSDVHEHDRRALSHTSVTAITLEQIADIYNGGFVKNLERDKIDRAMTETINRIGHIMGIKTVAEFAENEAIIGELRSMGVDYAQGFGVCYPTPLFAADAGVRSSGQTYRVTGM